jgi:hypothetical protein
MLSARIWLQSVDLFWQTIYLKMINNFIVNERIIERVSVFRLISAIQSGRFNTFGVITGFISH